MIASLSHSQFCAPAIPQLIKTMISCSRTHKNHLWKSRDTWTRLHELYNWIQGNNDREQHLQLMPSHTAQSFLSFFSKLCIRNDQRIDVFGEICFESTSFSAIWWGVCSLQTTTPILSHALLTSTSKWPSLQPDTLYKLLQRICPTVSSPLLTWRDRAESLQLCYVARPSPSETVEFPLGNIV